MIPQFPRSGFLFSSAFQHAASGISFPGPPDTAQITAALAAYQSANNAQSQAKDTFDREQEDIPPVDKSIREIWDHLEFAYREESGPSRRRKCREWGIGYIPPPRRRTRGRHHTHASHTTYTLKLSIPTHETPQAIRLLSKTA